MVNQATVELTPGLEQEELRARGAATGLEFARRSGESLQDGVVPCASSRRGSNERCISGC